MAGAVFVIAIIAIGALVGIILFLPVFGDEPIVPNPFGARVTTSRVILTIDGSLFLNVGRTYFNDLDLIVDVDNSTWTAIPLIQAQLSPQVVLFPESGDFTVHMTEVDIHPLLSGLRRGPWTFHVDIPSFRLVHDVKEVQGVIGVPEGIWDITITSEQWDFGADRDSSVTVRIQINQAEDYPITYTIIDDGIIPGIPGI